MKLLKGVILKVFIFGVSTRCSQKNCDVENLRKIIFRRDRVINARTCASFFVSCNFLAISHSQMLWVAWCDKYDRALWSRVSRFTFIREHEIEDFNAGKGTRIILFLQVHVQCPTVSLSTSFRTYIWHGIDIDNDISDNEGNQ